MDARSQLQRTAKRASLSRVVCPLRAIRECTLAPGAEWSPISGHGVVLLSVRAGSLRWRPGGGTVGAGEVALVRAAVGAGATAGRTGARFLPIAIQLLHAGEVDPLDDLALPAVVGNDGLGERMEALQQAALAATTSGWRRVEARGLALALLGSVLHRAEAEGALHGRAQRPDWLIDTLAFAERRLGDHRLEVDDLAAAAGMPASSFSRRFRILAGMPPRRWLEQRRMARARALLEAGAAVKAVAVQCGFASAAQFIRRFALLHGRTPGAWRSASAPPVGNAHAPAGRRNRPTPGSRS